MNRKEALALRLTTLREVAAQEWSSIGRFKVADLTPEAREQLADLKLVREAQAAVYANEWSYGELMPATQEAIDADLAADYPELFEA